MLDSKIPLAIGLKELGYEPLDFLSDFLNGADVPPVYRFAEKLFFDRTDIAALRGRLRIRALTDLIDARSRVIEAEAGANG